MQYPAFVTPWLGNGMTIALDAVLHVILSHGVAIGAMAMIVLAEAVGIRRTNADWDRFAKAFLVTLVIVITGVGAPTGVGIWLVTSAVAPRAIGSLLRVFFWPWFVEWMVFTAEVILLLLYYFKWDRWTGERKRLHLRVGIVYLVCSAATGFLISGILGFMLTPDGWPRGEGLAGAFFNETFAPQLLTRLAIGGTLGALFALAYAGFARAAEGIRGAALMLYGKIAAAGACVTALCSAWYLSAIPSAYVAHIPFSLLTSRLSGQPALLTLGLSLIAAIVLLFCAAAYRGSVSVVRVLAVPAVIGALLYVVTFERAREFIRGPYLMPGYLYANQILLSERGLLAEKGTAVATPWQSIRPPADRDARGAFLFSQNCTACHTLRGINGVVRRVRGRTEDGIAAMLGHLNEMVPFMPPFPGTDEERRTLARFLATLPHAGDDPSRYWPDWRGSHE